MRRALLAAGLGLCCVACDPTVPAGCKGFALSLAVETGGAATPEAAAVALAGTGTIPGLPRGGWHADGAQVRSGPSTVHVVQGTDGTWFVDSGETC